MALRFQRATVAAVKARIAITGPAGAGKTLGALLLAVGLLPPPRRVAVVDTERGRSRNHADDLLTDHGLEYDVAELDAHEPDDYVGAFDEAAAHVGPHGLVILDSLSHEWGAVLEKVDGIAARTGNKFASWNGPSQEHRSMINHLVRSPVHLIVTMRSEMDYALDGGKVQKLGLAPVQRKGVEYEWDLVFDVAANNTVTLAKCNAASLARALRPVLAAEKKLSPAVGAAIRAWLAGPRQVEAPPAPSSALHRPAGLAEARALPPGADVPPKGQCDNTSEVAEPAAPSASSPVSPAGPQGHAAAPPVPSHGADLAAEARYRDAIAGVAGWDGRAEAWLVHELSARALARCGFDKARYDDELLAAVAPETIKAVKADGRKRREAARKKVRAAWVAAGVAAERVERWSQAIVEADAPTGREVTAFLAAVETVAAAQDKQEVTA